MVIVKGICKWNDRHSAGLTTGQGEAWLKTLMAAVKTKDPVISKLVTSASAPRMINVRLFLHVKPGFDNCKAVKDVVDGILDNHLINGERPYCVIECSPWRQAKLNCVGAMLGALERANVPDAKIGKDWGACELYIKDGDSRPRYLCKLQNDKTWDIDEVALKSVTQTPADTIRTNAQVKRN